eukprot:9039225-Pyramimonas_sp.AAC.1
MEGGTCSKRSSRFSVAGLAKTLHVRVYTSTTDGWQAVCLMEPSPGRRANSSDQFATVSSRGACYVSVVGSRYTAAHI